MKRSIDINCDMGEGETVRSAEDDLALMPFISSCSIACGGHAGSEDSMRQTVRNALKMGLRIGAHPSYPDRENFGRVSLNIDSEALRISLKIQIGALMKILRSEGSSLRYVKPHGALYNDMAKNQMLALTVIETVKAIDPHLALMGLSGSHVSRLCEEHSIPFIAEAFADRRYLNSGQLAPRSIDAAVIEDPEAAAEQVLRILSKGVVTSITQQELPLEADSICVHSDTRGALEHVKAINSRLLSNDFTLDAEQ